MWKISFYIVVTPYNKRLVCSFLSNSSGDNFLQGDVIFSRFRAAGIFSIYLYLPVDICYNCTRRCHKILQERLFKQAKKGRRDIANAKCP